jgi:hypothetical protein
MSEDRIKRKNLWIGMNNIKQSDWIKAGYALGLRVVKSPSGTSHTITFRDPKNPDDNSLKSLITTVQVNLFKQANQAIFKKVIDFGIEEDEIWKALGMIK